MYLVGYVLKPHGIRGDVKIEAVSSYPERFKDLEYVYIHNNNIRQIYHIQRTRISGRFVYIKFESITSRTEAEKLRGAEVLVDQKDLIQPSKDEFFIHDLIGCRVLSDEDETLGIVSDVMQMPANDVLVVKSSDNKELLLPVIKSVIKRVDIAEKKISIHLLEGLIDR